MRHNLKIERHWLLPVTKGQKKAEIRKGDRDFSEGDELLLYTHDRREAELVLVTHCLPLSSVPELDGGPFVSLSIEPIQHLEGDAVAAELGKGSFG